MFSQTTEDSLDWEEPQDSIEVFDEAEVYFRSQKSSSVLSEESIIPSQSKVKYIINNTIVL